MIFSPRPAAPYTERQVKEAADDLDGVFRIRFALIVAGISRQTEAEHDRGRQVRVLTNHERSLVMASECPPYSIAIRAAVSPSFR